MILRSMELLITYPPPPPTENFSKRTAATKHNHYHQKQTDFLKNDFYFAYCVLCHKSAMKGIEVSHQPMNCSVTRRKNAKARA